VLHGRTALVTGASSGIGEACARALAAAGARVILCARRGQRLTALAEELGTEAYVLELDVRDRDQVTAAIRALPEGWSDIDLLLNNAGLAAGSDPLPAGEPDHWDRMLDTNVKGLLWVTRAVVPGMIDRGHGDVINIGSIAGRETYPGGAVYCASKAAVDRITAGLRMDLLGTGIRVTAIDPGLVETEFSTVRFDGDQERAAAVYQGMQPLRGSDIADVVVWTVGRPPHVQIADVLVLPTAQASATRVARGDTAPRTP
jgi:3-hydroxy acid dehydrogenase / malonic semialdehyde reductase